MQHGVTLQIVQESATCSASQSPAQLFITPGMSVVLSGTLDYVYHSKCDLLPTEMTKELQFITNRLFLLLWIYYFTIMWRGDFAPQVTGAGVKW